MDAYAVATEMTAATAGNANEDVRAALAHLSQALAETDPAAIESELTNARGKMASATAECLRLAIIGIESRIRMMIGTIEATRQELPESIRTRHKRLKSLRQQAVLRAAHGEAIVADLNDLLENARALETAIEEIYPESRKTSKSRWRKGFAWVVRIATGVGIAFAADLAFNIFPHTGG